jgi:pyruvate/2-oxoglutarate dehydrogenase complex dihydrolipoamide dehydrogenase (E3) component
MTDVIVIGAGPAGLVAALRAGDLGTRTTLMTSGEFGGMASNDGTVPVRTLAHAARLIREARQLGQYGISSAPPTLDYPRLLERVREVVKDVRRHAAFRSQLETAGVAIRERTGRAHFVDAHTIETESGLQLRADKILLCAGGVSRRLPVPGFEFTATHSDAWSLNAFPESMLVVGGGATGAQVASIFNAFGSRIQWFEAGPRVLRTEDEDVSEAVASAFSSAGIVVRENFGTIERFEKTSNGVRMVFTKNGKRDSAEATVVVVAVGWVADAAGLRLSNAGIALDSRGFVQVDDYLRTSSPHIFAAGDITGRLMLVPEAIQDGFVAATNAVLGTKETRQRTVSPIGSFTDPEYAQVGLTEARARGTHKALVVKINFDSTTRTIIDGRTSGFCKLIVDRETRGILGCHVVGERAVEIAQVASIVIASGMRVDDLARVPLSFPTYAGVLGRLAASATRQLNLPVSWQANQVEP